MSLYQPYSDPMNHPLTLSAGPLNCHLYFGDRSTEKTVQDRYGEFLINTPSENSFHILPSAGLVPKDEEFNLQLRVMDGGVGFFSSSTEGYFDHASRSGSINIATNRLDNPATVENALRHLFGVLALNRGYVFIHGAACAQDKAAYVFLGPSGSGKSTVASFAHERGYSILSDDFILLGRTGTLRAFSSPFFGQERLGAKNQESYAVKGVYLLHKNETDSLIEIDSTTEKVAHLLGNVPLAELSDTWMLNRILSVLEGIGEDTPLYKMQFRNSPDFLDLVENR